MIILRLFVLYVFCFAGQAEASPSVQDLEHSVHERVNAQRSSKGLTNLEYDENIAAIARQHSENMANRTVTFGHAGVQQRYEDIRLLMTALKLAENVAYAWGYNNPDEIVVQGWIKSDGHRKNMEGDYNVTGVGVAQGSDGAYYFTQLFAKKVN